MRTRFATESWLTTWNGCAVDLGRARVLVFTAVGHLASTMVQIPDHQVREMVPLGAHLKDRFGSDFMNILNLVVNGEIKYCSANPRRLMPLKPPPESAVETLFAAVHVPRHLLDLRGAPPPVSAWLRHVHDHWNGFGTLQFATARASMPCITLVPLRLPVCLSSPRKLPDSAHQRPSEGLPGCAETDRESHTLGDHDRCAAPQRHRM
jgi:hypothetical protein